MSTLRQQVSEFHIAMGQPIAEIPAVPSPERVKLRLSLIAEEFHELLAAAGYYENGDDWCVEEEYPPRGVNLVEVADALADLDYVIEGMRLEFGIDGKPIADEVHRSNMSKLDGVALKRADGKVLKSSRYQPPDIAGELKRQGWRGDNK